MKTYPERHIRRSELFQLILLQHLYTRPESSRLVFQGGTAIRWCHNGGRFLPPEVMTACRNDGYRPFLDAVKGLFRELRERGVVIPP